MSRISTLKVSVSGVRGQVGDSLSPRLLSDFAAAFGEYVGGGKVVVGRDTRRTGSMCEHAVISGLLSVGCQPVLLGIVPTPTAQLAVDQINANGGIAISASHNDEPWNALKFIGPSGIFLNHTEAAELLDVYNQPDRQYVEEDDTRNIRHLPHAFDLHRKRLFRHIDCEAVRNAGFRIALDCCNGAGALTGREFLEDLGCRVVPLYEDIDGRFHRRPEPVPEHLETLCRAVVEHKCHLGFAQDPDADRLVIVGPDGRPIGEQLTVVLAAEHVLAHTPGPVVVNAQTTRSMDAVAERYKVPLHLAPVGEINVIDEMVRQRAVIGGEGSSGGVIWPAFHLCRDSFTAMALVLECLAQRGCALPDLLGTIPRYAQASLKVPCSAGRAVDIIRTLTERHADARPLTIDGLRLDWDDAWVLVRASNTEPIMRIFAEAGDPARAQDLVQQFAGEIVC